MDCRLFFCSLAQSITSETADKHQHLVDTISIEELIQKFNIEFDLYKFIKPNYIDFINVKNTNFEAVEKTEQIKKLLNTQASYSKLNETIYLVYLDPDFKGLFNREGTFRKSLGKTNKLKAEFIISVNQSDFKKKLKDINAIWDWKVNRNEKRAALEARFGYDVKHGMHLHRLLYSAKQLLLTGNYTPRLKNEDLQIAKDILSGQVSYKDLIALAESLQKELNQIIKSGTSDLQEKANIIKINDLLMDIYNQF